MSFYLGRRPRSIHPPRPYPGGHVPTARRRVLLSPSDTSDTEQNLLRGPGRGRPSAPGTCGGMRAEQSSDEPG